MGWGTPWGFSGREGGPRETGHPLFPLHKQSDYPRWSAYREGTGSQVGPAGSDSRLPCGPWTPDPQPARLHRGPAARGARGRVSARQHQPGVPPTPLARSGGVLVRFLHSGSRSASPPAPGEPERRGGQRPLARLHGAYAASAASPFQQHTHDDAEFQMALMTDNLHTNGLICARQG